MNFAIIQNDTVIALIGIFPTNWIQFQEVVPVPLNIEVGDKYIMGRFYRNNVLVPTPEEILEDQYINEIADLIEIIYQNDMEVIENV